MFSIICNISKLIFTETKLSSFCMTGNIGRYELKSLIHFTPMFHFYTPWKRPAQIFSYICIGTGYRNISHWREIG